MYESMYSAILIINIHNIRVSCSSNSKASACDAGDLGWEVPTEKGMAVDSSTLAWRIPWTEKPGGLQSMG